MGKVLLHGHLDVCILVSSSTSFSSTSFSSTASSTNRNKYRTPKQVKSLRTVPGKSFHTFRAVFAHCLNSSITHDAYSSVGLRPPLGGNYGQFSNWLLHCSQKQLRLFIAAERGSSCRSFLSLPLTKRALRDKRNFSCSDRADDGIVGFWLTCHTEFALGSSGKKLLLLVTHTTSSHKAGSGR